MSLLTPGLVLLNNCFPYRTYCFIFVAGINLKREGWSQCWKDIDTRSTPFSPAKPSTAAEMHWWASRRRLVLIFSELYQLGRDAESNSLQSTTTLQWVPRVNRTCCCCCFLIFLLHFILLCREEMCISQLYNKSFLSIKTCKETFYRAEKHFAFWTKNTYYYYYYHF